MTVSDALKSVLVVPDADLKVNGGRYTLQQGSAIKVRGYTASTIGSRKVKGGDALPVYVLTDTQIESGGGRWKVNAGQAIQVTDVIEDARGIIQGHAIPVFPVDGQGNFDSNFGFNPTKVSGLVLWLEASLGFTLNDGDPVATWFDQSGNGNHVTQGIAARRPTYRTNIINGRSAVRFDGTDDRLATANPLLQVGTGAMAVIVAVQGNDSADAKTYVGNLQNAGAFGGIIFKLLNTEAFHSEWRNVPGAGNTVLVDPTAGNVVWNIVSSVRDSASAASLFVNGALVDGPDPAVRDIDGGEVLSIGTERTAGFEEFWNGDMYAVIAYESDIGATARQLVEQYLSNKTGITLP